ncbi:hypothetical protein GCK32_002170 [Trichostrongylus colubriformis]|uniref:Peptidase aspartic putative domain-containing protein n=1 Tax=Trichostrongylus colubriformis TaxID=6319 RepID=A0AAN8EYP7_TRICO
MSSQPGRSNVIHNTSSSAKPRNSNLYSHTATATDCSEKPPTTSSKTQSPAEKLISTSISRLAPTETETLMCATVTLFNPSEPSKQMKLTAFLDSGSNKCYITQHVAATLSCQPSPKKKSMYVHLLPKIFHDSNVKITTSELPPKREQDDWIPILTRALY